jgi:hypothetical protein
MKRTLNRAGLFLARATILATTFAAVAFLVGFARRSGF